MKKLNKYLSLSAAVLGSGTLNASIIYTDVNPDQLLDTDGDTYSIDVDNSGSNDFTFTFQAQSGYWGTWRNPKIDGIGGNNIAGFSSGGGYGGPDYFADLYSMSDSIGASNNWNGSYGLFGWLWNDGSSTQTGGNWIGAIDKYIALQFSNAGNTYYGWARIDIGPSYDFIIIKDFASESMPNTPILAGANTNANLIANNITSTDIANNHNGLDLEVSFEKASSELGISEYRVIVAKASQVSNFSLSNANSSFSYLSVIPDGNNHTITFNSGSKDADGDLIVEDVAYNVFVLSVPDLINSTVSNLSESSNEVTLKSQVGINESLFSTVNITVNNKHISISSKEIIDNIIITDLSGKQVHNQSNTTNSIINIENESSGIYLITIESNNKIETKKIIL